MDAALAQVLLAGLRQREADALPPVPIANSEAVHVASPSVPSGDQGPDDLTATFGNQEGSRGIRNQALDVIKVVGGTRVLASSPLPQGQYGRHIRLSATAYGDLLVGQVRSINAVPTAPSACRGSPS